MSYTVDIYDSKGAKKSQLKLSESIFNDDNINESLVGEFIKLQLANKRLSTAHTKTRGEVSCSTKKLYRQKGTGRARVGDAGSPIRRKGGVAFGPRNDVNYKKSMPKKMRRKALFSALTMKAKSDEILGLEEYPHKQIKTKSAYDIMKKLNLNEEKTLLVVPGEDDITIKSFRNLENVKYVFVNYLNPYDLLTHKKVLFIKDAFDKLEDIFIK